MLLNLHVKNLALIEDIDVSFEDGLNILTGETGAGKSLVIGSVNIALGAKINKELIRNDADYALVELVFSVDDRTASIIREMDIQIEEDNQIIVSRKILNGRSISKINGETVSISVLKEVMSYLIDIHGQHEHQSLLYRNNHLKILDEFAGDDIKELKDRVKCLYGEYTKAKNALNNFNMDDEKRIREIEFCKYEINEIDAADLKQSEDEEIEKLYKKLSNSQKMAEIISKVYNEFGYDNNVGNSISYCMRCIAEIADLDEQIGQIYSQMVDMDSIYSDISRSLSSYMDSFEYDEKLVYETEKRLDLINHLKSKYGRTIEQIFEYRENKNRQLEVLENYSEEKQKAENKVLEIKDELLKVSLTLSEIRKEKAKIMETDIVKVLKELNFLSVDFAIDFKEHDNPTENGIDDVEFLISTNPGESLKPLAKIASGGELSRIMLAIKTIVAEQDGVDTLIFDEIDAGISGRTAQLLAEKLNLISRKNQVICITHLPQIAAMADSHYLIEKSVLNNKTNTNILKLNEQQSVNELVRIIGGAQITDATYEHARQMKEMAGKQK